MPSWFPTWRPTPAPPPTAARPGPSRFSDGVKFQDGTPITCADVKYGVSRHLRDHVITDGPTYAIQDLDIPTDANGNSVYKGPTTPRRRTTTLPPSTRRSPARPTTRRSRSPERSRSRDFNYTMTLLAFSPVPKAKDTGEKYDDNPVSLGSLPDPELHQGPGR